MSTRTTRSPKTIRRGMKIDSRPGYVTVIARATEGGSLEVKEEEYLEYERAEQTKNDETAAPEAKAMASILSRKLLNKWRERWVTSAYQLSINTVPRGFVLTISISENPLYAEDNDASHHSNGMSVNGEYDGNMGKSPTLSNQGTSSSSRRRSPAELVDEESDEVELAESGRSGSTVHYRSKNESNGCTCDLLPYLFTF